MPGPPPDQHEFTIQGVKIRQVPQTLSPTDYATGLYGEHDELPVQRGHDYVIRTDAAKLEEKGWPPARTEDLNPVASGLPCAQF